MEEHLQVSSSRSQRLSVISKSEQVQVSDSQFTVAGGHITNFAVNIAFNPQPTESVSPTSWSTLLGQWLGRPYSFSKPLHELGSAPLPRPTQAPEGGRGNSMYPPLYEHATAGTSCEWRDSSDDFVFVSLEGPKPHDIYFRQLYPRSDGYPCANPRPRGRPVKLGDIGFLYGGRFCVLQNLETLPESVLQGKPIPPLSSVYDRDALAEGHTVTGGIDDCKNKMAENGIGIDEITFQCNRDEGAMLAITSPADLHDFEQIYPLREYLCQHATQLFHFLREQHRLPSETSLYVVTGTTKSASWAIATHGQPMQSPHNSLALKRIPRDGGHPPLFRWTRKGNAQTDLKDHEPGQEKIQCLFLRGFLLTPSDDYRRGLKLGDKLKAPAEPSNPGTFPHKSHGENPAHNGLGAGSKGSATGSNMATGNHLTLSLEGNWDVKGLADLDEVLVCPMPPPGTPEDYPSFRINKAMLRHTVADFAISHDDDWRFHVKDAAAESEVGQNLYASAVEKLNKILPKHIDFRNGVAFLDPPSEVQRQFRTGLIRASERGDAAAVALFLKLPGVEVNAADKKGVTALMSASCGEVAKLLLDAPQILVNAKDREGRTALMHALGRTNAEVAQVLLEDPAIDAHLADHGGCTTLKYALKGKNVEVLVLLLKVLGIHVDLTDDQKRGMLSRMLQTKGPEAATHRVPISDTRPHMTDTHVDNMQRMKAPFRDHRLQVFQTLLACPLASLDGECDTWLRENALAIEAAIHMFPAEEHPIAWDLAMGIYPRLSLFTLAALTPLNEKRRGTFKSLSLQCRTSHLANQIPYQQSFRNILGDLLNEYSNTVKLRQVAESAIGIDIQYLAIAVRDMLAEPTRLNQCLSAAQHGKKEQDLVDALHKLLDIDALMHFRSIFLQGLLQVAETTGRVPGALVHNDAVIVESATAITSGAFGDIWRGVLYGQPVAMKVLRTTKRPDDILRSHSREAIVWSRLRHPNVLPFYGIYCWTPHPSTPQRMALLSPWLEAGNIVGYLRHHADVDKESMVLDIAQGLHYLHSFQPAIVHGNLKGNNILINSAGRTCIADFGLSKLINGSSSGPSGGLYGRELYTAPELLFWEHDQGDRAESGPSHPPSATIESDVYAFGCVCYEIFIGKPRFFDLPIMARLLSVRNNTKCPKPSHMSNTLWKNVKACWSTLPQERPTMAHFVQSLVLAQENNNKSVAGDGFCDTKSKVHCHPNPHAPFNFLPLRIQAADSFSTANTITAVGPSTVHSPTSTVVPPTPTLVVTTTPNFSFNQGDIIIAVMGPTGTGKSTFINDVMGTPVAAVGHGVSSCTSNIGVYGCEHIAFSNRRVFLVDTPGFGVGTSDEKTLESLARWLFETYSREISLSAVLYFMSIGEVRLSGRDLGNINVFQKLCGHAAFKNVAVITTGWEEVGEVAAAEREKSLKTEFLKEFLDGGGRCQRYRRTNSMMRNAWDIVDMFDGDKRPLLIQDEMVNKRLSLWRTSAFKAISKLRSLLRSIRVEGQGPSRGM